MIAKKNKRRPRRCPCGLRPDIDHKGHPQSTSYTQPWLHSGRTENTKKKMENGHQMAPKLRSPAPGARSLKPGSQQFGGSCDLLSKIFGKTSWYKHIIGFLASAVQEYLELIVSRLGASLFRHRAVKIHGASG